MVANYCLQSAYVPSSKSGTRQRSSLNEVQSFRHMHQAILVEASVFAKCTIDDTSKSSSNSLLVERATEMALIEEGCNFVTSLETCDMLADSDDSTRTIGSGNDSISHTEGVLAFGNDQVTIVEGHSLNW
jgi:hypothetical protein